jgi:hypothetical protein
MLFRENVKEVKEGDIEKKSRVIQVKKRRKKTEEERRRDKEEVNEKKKFKWWGEEKVNRGGNSAANSEEQERIVICISSDGLETDMDNIINHASSSRLYDDTDRGGYKDEEMGVVALDTTEGDKDEENDERNELSVVTQVAVVANDAISQVESLSPMSDNSEPEENKNNDAKEDNAAACGTSDHLDLKSWDESSAAGDERSVEGVAQVMHQVETPRTANHSEDEPQNKKSQNQSLDTPELPDDEGFGKATVQLAPRIRSQRSYDDNETQLQQVLEPPFIRSSGPGNVSPMSPCFEDGQDAWTRDTTAVTRRSPVLILPDLNSENNGNSEESPLQSVASPPSIFRRRGSDDRLGDMEIQPSMSNDTAVASNVDELSKSDRYGGEMIPKQLASADIVPSYKLKSVESYKTDGSSISYFSYEDVSIEDEESEMCAVCICPYEEGDIRVFSKHCSHVFHKDCIFEWLVKGHNECPCCRADMVTKSEIKATSASLIGTEQLNHAMQQATVEAPPFRARRGPRLPRHMLAMARRDAWREWRASHQLQTNTTMPPQSPNAHWLWTARHQGVNSGSTSHVAPAAAATSPTNNINHNNDWLWTMRFDNMANQNNSPRQLRTARSSDAIDNNRGNGLTSRSSDGIDGHRANESALTSRSFDALDSQRTSNQQPLYHQTSSAGSLAVGRNLHPNWGNCQNSTPVRHNVAMSPMSHRLHPHWQQRASRRDVDPPLIEIPARPAVQPIRNESPQTLNGHN